MRRDGSLRRAWATWLLALVAVGALLAALDYRTRDPDSLLYTGIAASLVDRPFVRWIAPRWVNYVGDEELFREHPAGLFVAPALLARLGYPADQATYAVNAAYQVLSILLIGALAGRFATTFEARTLMWLLLLLPIAFVFRIRGNHEQAVLACVLAAAWATDRARARPAWFVLTTAALGGLFLVKGIFVLAGIAVCAWLLLVRGLEAGTAWRRERPAWAGLAGSVVVVIAFVWAYEAGYRAVAGESFLGVYLPRQLGVSFGDSAPGGLLSRASGLLGYAARVAWFAAPWSLVAVVAAWRERRGLLALWRGRAGAAGGEGGAAGLAFGLGATALFVAAFSLSDRSAERYIFPAYFLAAAVGGVAALRSWPRFRVMAERLDAYHPWVPAGVWMALILLRTGTPWLPRVDLN